VSDIAGSRGRVGVFVPLAGLATRLFLALELDGVVGAMAIQEWGRYVIWMVELRRQ